MSVYGRSTVLFPLAVLAVLALLTLWIENTVKLPIHKLDGSSRHDPDYYMENFFTSKTDINGHLRYMLAAVVMKHYPDDETTDLVRPKFTQYGVGKPYTQIEGQKGTVSNDGKEIQLFNAVKVTRQAFADRGEMVLNTDYLKVLPDQDLVTTDRPVVITQAPKTVIHGTGLIYDKKANTVSLLSDVRVHYERTPTAQTQALKSSAPNPIKSRVRSKNEQ